VVQTPSKLDPTVMKDKKKTFVEINCSTIKNLKQFINGVIIPYIQDKDVTILFDEASEIPHVVAMALLTILNPNPTNKTTFAYEEYVCDFDFSRQTFLFATSEIQKVFHALADRLERVTLEEYTPQDLADIVKLGLPDVTPEGDMLLDVATVLRGNARAAQKLASKIMTYLRGNKIFTRADWESLKRILSINPIGLNALEVQVLRYLAGHPDGTSLTGLSAKTGMSRESLQKDVELYLQKHNLMEITTTGRKITSQGLMYLKELDVLNKENVKADATADAIAAADADYDALVASFPKLTATV
jgi:Holliday junction resolvasome RuvABC ATP-dependent DNA helicase subunit